MSNQGAGKKKKTQQVASTAPNHERLVVAESSPSRRDFIRTSSLIVAGGTLAGTLSIARSAHAFGSDEIKIGLIGAGGRGTGAAAQAMNTEGATKLVAIGDAFENRLTGALRGLSRDYKDKVDVPKDRQFIGLEAFKRVLECDLDMVILATPPGFRPLHFEAAVNAGKNIFMEKPVAVDGAGVRKVLAANEVAKQKGLAVAVGLQRRHEPRYIETIKRLQEGAIGDIILSRAYWNGGGLWNRERQPNQTEMEYQVNNWYYFNWLCGDHIVEQHIHNLDVINWLKNGFPVEANGQGGREVRVGKEFGQIYDHHFVEFTYADGSKMYSQCRHIPGCWNPVAEYCHGSNGSAAISDATIKDRNGETTWRYGRGGGDGHQQEHHDLFAKLRAGERPNEGEYGAMSTMTSILGRMATYSGKVIRMEDALNSDVIVSPVEKYTSWDDTPPVLPDADGFYPVPVPGIEKVV
ncbi:MAG: Gfo/Idh/MocA family oxidoreductase [Pirellulaceae bacterium]|nr:Gfo/Idh/MocA family oxidoreductase [Planctomycetales bacterium]